MIALIDYGAGNLTSVRKGLAAAGAALLTPRTPLDLARADAAIVPGVGHFDATRALDERWRQALANLVARQRPLLGICLGMQWLFDGSEEAPAVPGLALIAGRSVRLNGAPSLKVPHVGWNDLRLTRPSRLLDGVPDGAYVYFTHSYAAPLTDACVAATTYGLPFAAAVEQNEVFGVQFHPEKSGEAGVRILRNFVALAERR